MTNNNIKTKKGFTIIEVVLVLAVAGLIFMMVFLALPALQRSQKDTQRRDQLSSLVTQIIQYQANNRNKIPTGQGTVTPDPTTGEVADDAKPADLASFYRNYLLAGGDVFEDPNGNPYALEIVSCQKDGKTPTSNGVDCAIQRASDTFENQAYKILITYSSSCEGETIKSNTGARKVTVAYKLEGGGTFCQGN